MAEVHYPDMSELESEADTFQTDRNGTSTLDLSELLVRKQIFKAQAEANMLRGLDESFIEFDEFQRCWEQARCTSDQDAALLVLKELAGIVSIKAFDIDEHKLKSARLLICVLFEEWWCVGHPARMFQRSQQCSDSEMFEELLQALITQVPRTERLLHLVLRAIDPVGHITSFHVIRLLQVIEVLLVRSFETSTAERCRAFCPLSASL
jgi:hypothetical protein